MSDIETDKKIMRFSDRVVGRELIEGRDKKIFYEFDIVREVPIGYTKMTVADVVSYFKSVKHKWIEVGGYCDRCGSLIGDNAMTKVANDWKSYKLCSSCYKNKITGQGENTPDLEDLERFKIDADNYV